MNSDSLTSSDRWAIAFTKRLVELQPDLGLARVSRICAELFSEVGDTDPVEAAEGYAALCAPKGAAPKPR